MIFPAPANLNGGQLATEIEVAVGLPVGTVRVWYDPADETVSVVAWGDAPMPTAELPEGVAEVVARHQSEG